MSDLEIDYAELQSAVERLSRATDAFQNASLDAHALADLTGHPRVAGKVRDFADNWDYHRGQLLQSMQTVLAGLQAIEETFREVDASLAKSVGEPPASAGPAGRAAGSTQGTPVGAPVP